MKVTSAGCGRCLVVAVLCLVTCSAQAAEYLPPVGSGWAVQSPKQAGFDPAKLQAAVDFAIAQSLRRRVTSALQWR